MEHFGVIGYPIGHSLSPVMHNAAFKHLGMDAIYLAFQVKPNELENAIRGAKALGFTGLNVTIPFKEAVLEYVKAKGIARKIKAINTVDLRKMEGYNTDAYGAMKALENGGVEVKDKVALLVGAGGAARAIAFALVENDAKVVITNRTEERGLKLAEDVRRAGEDIECIFHPYDGLERLNVDIIINATPLGMKGFEKRLPVPEAMVKDVVVFDTVYNPKETPLISLAKKRGCKVVYGIDMLVYQGAEAFRIWTGKDAPVDVMRSAIEELGCW
jgi:shikimate dehydrogenase